MGNIAACTAFGSGNGGLEFFELLAYQSFQLFGFLAKNVLRNNAVERLNALLNLGFQLGTVVPLARNAQAHHARTRQKGQLQSAGQQFGLPLIYQLVE